jgi:hypothetical protein
MAGESNSTVDCLGTVYSFSICFTGALAIPLTTDGNFSAGN